MRQFQSKRAFGPILFSLLPAVLAVFGVSAAFSQTPFYHGKTITLIVGVNKIDSSSFALVHLS